MHEHELSGKTYVFQTHPNALVMFASMSCGCCWGCSIPSPILDPGFIETWFEVRRDLRQSWEDA